VDFPLLFSPLLSFFWVLFISSKLILQMAKKRNRNANTNAKNNVENNNDAAPTLEQVLAMQAHMLQTIVNMQNVQPQAPPPPPPPRDRLGDFQCTKTPTISYAVEPMDADDWLKFVEKKFQVVRYNNHEKVLLASHQLLGPTADW
jgi:hypothetical protein